MKLTILLHFYQPYNQQDDILRRVVNECYIPLTESLLLSKYAKVTINISGVLTQLLGNNKDYNQVIHNIIAGVEQGKIELMSSANYHAILPLLSEDEVLRQILLNDEINRRVFGSAYSPKGFFAPEMAISSNLLKTIKKTGYSWIIVPQTALGDANSHLVAPVKSTFMHKDSGINFLVRNKRLSSLILSSVVKNGDELMREAADLKEDAYWVAVMDAETFGHHRIGHEKFLVNVLENPEIEPTLMSNIFSLGLPKNELNIRSSTWSNEEQDFWLEKESNISEEDMAFLLWKDPSNPIHKLQWKLAKHVINAVKSCKKKDNTQWKKAREKLDKAIASDQFWWASAKPWWSLEMIEQGAYDLVKVLDTLTVSKNDKKTAEDLYRKIIDKAFEWQRTGLIRKRHTQASESFMKEPLKKRTHLEWYNQLILEFEDQMEKAAGERNYEKAIKWRDAIYKMKLGTDIYDILHVVDELWSARSIPLVKPFFEHDAREFSEFAKEYFEGFSDPKDFEKEFKKWKEKREKRYY